MPLPLLEFEHLRIRIHCDAGREERHGCRAAIPGGWLVWMSIECPDWSTTGHRMCGLAFVPDADHSWDGGSVAL